MCLEPSYFVEKQAAHSATLLFVRTCRAKDVAAGRLAIDDRQSHSVNRREIVGVFPPGSRQVRWGLRGIR